MNLGIASIESYLPKRTLTAQDLADQFGFDINFVQNKLGVQKLFQSDSSENTSDLAAKALNVLLEKRPNLREEIGVLILVTQTPDFRLPHTASIVLDKTGITKTIPCFDVSLGCSGWVYGLSIIQSFMISNNIRKGVLITAETYTKYLNPEDRNTKCLFSDGASATLISENPIWTTGRFTFGSKPSHYKDLILGNGTNQFLNMNGPNIYQFAIKEVPSDVQSCLDLNNTNLEQLDAAIFHQANRYMIQSLAKRLKLPEEKNIDYMPEFGNTVSSTIPMALAKFTKQNPKSSNILVSGFGVGLSWASTILRKANQ